MINWQEVPFVRLLIPFLLGLLSAAYSCWYSIGTPALLGTLSCCFFIFYGLSRSSIGYRFRQISGWVLMLLLYLLGQVIWRVQTPDYQHQHYLNEKHTEATFLFRINEHKPSRSGKSQQLKISILGIEAQPGVLKRIKGQSFCYLPADIKLDIGTCILAKGRLDTIAGPAHAGSFDFANYMALQGMVRQLRLQTDQIHILPKDPFPTLRGALRKISSQLQERLSTALPESTAGLVIALVLGQKNQLDSAVREDYTQVGAMHVLAVSGMHVGILAMGLSFLLNFWKGGHPYIRFCKGLLAVVGIWLFALLTGASPSVLRAATMFSLFTLGKQLYLNQNVWNIIAATALLMLSVQSRAIFTVGFQLSYLAVAAIIYFQPKLSSLISVKHQLANYFWQLFTLGIAAQLGTAILSIHYFHQFPLYFWLSGLLIVPLATVALLLGIGVLILVDVPHLGNLLAELLHHLIWIMNQSMGWISEFPNSTLASLYLSKENCLLLLSLFFLCTLWLELRRKYLAYLIFSLTLLTGWLHYVQQIAWLQQQELLIYRHQPELAFSLIKGQDALTFYNQEAAQEALAYAQSSYYQSRNIKRDSSIYLNHGSGLIHWNNQRILVLQNRTDLCQFRPIPCIDFLILGPNFYTPEPDLLQTLEVQTIYLHPGLSSKAQHFWETQFQQKGSLIQGAGLSTSFLYFFKS